MRKSIRVAVVATAICASLAGFAPAASAAPPPSGPPGQLPPPSYAEALASPDWAPTPVGLAYKSCVHEVPDGAFVSEDGTVSVGGVVVEKLPACPYSGIVPVPRSPQAQAALAQAATNGEKNHGASAGKDSQAPVPYAGGWWLDSWWTSSSQITNLIAHWTVPANPASTGALLYLFSSVEPGSGGAIVQPVLQWGTSPLGGGNYWALATWYVVGKSVIAASPLLKTSAGHLVTGTMSRTGSVMWTVKATDSTTGGWVGMSANTSYTSWTAVQGGVLETYYVMWCSQLPNTTSLVFSNISVSSAAGLITPSFTAEMRNSACFGSVTATSSSTTLRWTPTP